VGYYSIEGTITGASPTPLADGAGKPARLRPRFSGGVLHLNHPRGVQAEEIALHDTRGTRILHFAGHAASLDVSRVPSGLYVLSARVNGARTVQHVVKP
jgi:hypothetical protein